METLNHLLDRIETAVDNHPTLCRPVPAEEGYTLREGETGEAQLFFTRRTGHVAQIFVSTKDGRDSGVITGKGDSFEAATDDFLRVLGTFATLTTR